MFVLLFFRVIFIPTMLACLSAVLANALSCRGQLTFMEVYGSSNWPNPGRTLRNLDLSKCKEYCLGNRDFRGDYIDCWAFQYSSDLRECNLYQSMPESVLGDYNQADNTAFAQKLCLSDVQSLICNQTGKLAPFSSFPQYTLVGFADIVLTAWSREDCISECIESVDNHGILCASVLYFPIERQCVLNSMSRASHSENFVQNFDGSQLEYMDNYCAQDIARTLQNSKSAVTFGTWSPWGACSVTCGQGIQVRRRTCIGGRDKCMETSTDEAKECVQAPCVLQVPKDRPTSPPVSDLSETAGWGQWSLWGICSVTCGQGAQYRTRACFDFSRRTCQGAVIDTKQCSVLEGCFL